MKATPKQQEKTRKAIEPLDTAARRSEYLKAGHSDERYRWDLFWLAIDRHAIFYSDYDNLKDAHIDTMLRGIVKPLGRRP